jgi:DNA-binding transcriptional regulator YhcF (GntR family)
MDAEWIALIEEAKSLGLTVEDVQEWLSEVTAEK